MTKQNSNGANLGFERQLWQAADALCCSMDAAEDRGSKMKEGPRLDKLVWANLEEIGYGG